MPGLRRVPGPADLNIVSRSLRGRLVRFFAVAGVSLLAVAAAADAAQKDPRQLVLARSDLPTGAKPVAKSTGPGAAISSVLVDAAGRTLLRESRHYQSAYHLPAKDISSAAFVFRSVPAARTAFARLSRSLPDVYRHLTLRRLGDAQVTAYVVADAYEHRFVVRRGSVVWQLDVLDWSGGPRNELTVAAVMLARKQQARIG
jgi:hypothetical protein